MCAIVSLSSTACENLTRPVTSSPEIAPAAKPPVPQTQPLARAETKADDSLAALIAYTNWMREANPAQLQHILPGAEVRAKDPGNVLEKMRLAVLLSLPHAPFRNETRALALVEESLRAAPQDSDLAMFGYMLRWDLQDRRRIQADYERTLTQERTQRDTLEQKLNELKAIEEQIHRRETVTPN